MRRVGKGFCKEPGRAERARMGSSRRKRAEVGILEPTGGGFLRLPQGSGYLIPPLKHRAHEAGSVIEGKLEENPGKDWRWQPNPPPSCGSLQNQRGMLNVTSQTHSQHCNPKLTKRVDFPGV